MIDNRYPHLNAGWQHFQRKELDAAIRCFSESIDCNENLEKSYYLRGNVWLELTNYELAISDYTAAISYNPKFIEARLNRGTAYHETNQMSGAMDDFNEVIKMRPTLFNGFFCRGRLSRALKDHEKAMDDFQRARSLAPSSAIIGNNIGTLYMEMGEYAKALQIYDEILVANPNYVQALSNRGAALKAQRRYPEAIQDLENAIRANPDFAAAYYNLGDVQREVGTYRSALQNFREARFKGHQIHAVNWNMGLCHLAIREFAIGWDLFEDRLQADEFLKTAFVGHSEFGAKTDVRNSQNDLCSKTVFLASEQGVGDCIMFLSILPDLIKDAAKVFCQVDHRLTGIFSRLYPEATFFGPENSNILDAVHVDRHIRIGSLGYTYRQKLEDFPETAYLAPDPARVAHWKSKLPSEPDKLKIGLSWRGGTKKTNGKGRSLELEQLAGLLDNQDCIFVSLQYGEVEAEVATFNATNSKNLLCFPSHEITDFEDFGGLIGALDGVVSVQNTTVHMSGALGKPCLVLLPFMSEWRYGASGDDMPWYHSVKLYRQSSDGQWTDTIEKVIAELELLRKKSVAAR